MHRAPASLPRPSAARPGGRRHVGAARTAGLLLGMAIAAAPARAQDVFSPGPLAKGHAELDGLQNCTRCHAAGQKLSPDRCLECHKEVRARIAEGKGLHGRIPAGERACENCHHEHQGRSFPLVDWGPGGERRFDHAKTGWPLRGKHARLECATCHESRRVTTAEARQVAAKGRHTFLGLPLACADCHFDEHRGQAARDCQRCHDEKAWKPAPGFDHRKTAYPLQGLHARVGCAKCHESQADPAGKRAFPAAVSERFLRFKPVAHAACTDCHKDPHQNRFGQACATCHSVAGWKKLKPAGQAVGFHDKTRYPLRGKHAEAACQACHGPFRGQKAARYKGLAFETCTRCHADTHVGQMGRSGSPEAACERCHGVDGFQPAKFDLAEHDKTRYPLEGGHRAVACALCHPRDPKLEARFPAATRSALAAQKRPATVSLFRVDRNVDARRCQACHRDVHAGQFASRVEKGGCQACHELASFKQVRFDHAKDSRFPLLGKHATAACGSCHRAGAGPSGPVVRYRPLDLACASCHADPHVGQFAVKGATECSKCHFADDWKKLLFKHEPPFTGYRLDGKHRQVACARCHQAVAVARGVEVRRYRPLPTACESCHRDFHRGAFRGVKP